MDNGLPRLNFYGSEWGGIRDWLEQELQDSYRVLARHDIGDVEAHQVRGRIILINKMLEWPALYAAFNGPQ